MDEKRYLIEVLLRAREQISQVAQKAVRALDDVGKAQRRVNDESARATAPLRNQVSALEKLVEAHVREKRALEDSARSLRSSATARREAANESRRMLEELQKQARLERAQATEREKRDIEEVRRIRLQIAERNASDAERTKAFNRETQQMRQEAALLEALNRESAASNQRRAAELGVQIAQIQQSAREHARSATEAEQSASREERAYTRAGSAVDRHSHALERARAELGRMDGSIGQAERRTGPFTRSLERMGISSNNARSGLRGLNAEFQGFQIALAIKYAQSLISVLVALAAQLLAVAAAAGQAAVGLGAALAAGAAQAVPVVGILIAAFARFANVLKVVKLQNQQQLTASHDAQRAARAQTTATEQITSAERRVADAHRNTQRAVADLARTRSDAAREELQSQQAVTRARQDAIRTVQDLMAAEEDAAQSLLRAQQSRQQAIESGDVMGAVQGDIDVTRARRDLGRARQDAAPARARGIEGIDAVRQAEQRLADTRRQGARQIQQAEQRLGDTRRDERQATQDLSRTRRDAADQLAQETAAVDKLSDSIAQLSPAERQLYRRVLALQDTYKRVARPITDIITRAFTGVVDRINRLIQDPRIIRGFRNIATQIADSIRSVAGEATGPQSVGFFEVLSAEAARNIPIATRILINFFKAARNIVIDAVPAFRLLLGYVEDYSERAKDASGNSRGLTRFFVTGVRYAKAFFDLGLAVVQLFLALAGRGGAAGEGIRTVHDLTGAVDDLTTKVNHNAGRIRHFFAETHDAFFAVLSVVGTLASAMIGAFSARSVETFADFLNRVIIPAIANVLEIMGAMVTVFHQVFSLPGVAQVAQMAATMLILARGLTVIRSAIGSIMGIMPTFLRSMGLMVAAEEGAAVGFAAMTPAGWVVVAILAVVAAVVLLDKKLHFLGPTWRWLKHAAADAWEGIKNGADAVVDWFSDVWTQGLLKWIRYPFVWLAQHAVGPAFGWLIQAAKDAIGFLRDLFSGGGFFGVLGDIISGPFRALPEAVRLAFGFVKTIVVAFLDVIAGRFDEAGDAISGFATLFVDTLLGAITSAMSVLEKFFAALGKIPKIGGPFKAAAKEIHDARTAIDEHREASRKQREEQKRANDTVNDALPTLVSLRQRYEDAKDRVDKLTPGTKQYRQAAKDARDAGKDYNDSLKDTADKAGAARQPIGRLRRNISDVGNVSADTADVIAKNLNDVLRQVGARTIRLNTRAYRRSGIDVITEATGHAATGGVLSRANGLRRRLWGGGMANPYGGAADDHVLMSPAGVPVAALSGTEGIVNTPQMGVINDALSFTRQMTGMPWGSLNDLWSSGMRHFAEGGGLQPAIRGVATRINRMFGTTTTSTTGGQHAAHSYHPLGLAVDLSGTSGAMERATHWINRSGLWHSLLEGIHNPGLSVKNGRMVSPSFWGAGTWANHLNHIHLALRSLADRLIGGIGRVRMPQIAGLGDDALSRIARGGARTLTRAANRYLERQMARLGGADTNVRGLGAEANVVTAFRRAMRVMRANPKERLAGWEAGIVESGLRNLHYGDRDSLGSLQERASIFGRGHALNPFASMVRFLRDAISRRPFRGTAGQLAQAVQRSAFPGRYDAVAARARRFMQTGGPLAGVARATTARVIPRSAFADIFKRVSDVVAEVAKSLEGVSRTALRRSGGLVRRIQVAFARITGDGGLLDQIRAQAETIADRARRALQQRQFRVTRQGPRRRGLTDAQVARGELEALQAQRGGLQTERGAIEGGLASARSALAAARAQHNKRAKAAAQAAINNLRARLDANTTALAQNAQDQVEAQENFQQALLSAVNDAAERRNAAIDRWSRLAKALGRSIDPNVVLGRQIDNMRTQITGLQGVLKRARATGNTELANQVRDQIDDLNVQIAEAVARQFQNAIDQVNAVAQRRIARLDRAARLAQLGGRTDFGAMGGILTQRGDVLTQQRAGLLGLLAQAQAAGNTEQVDNLVDQIDELNVQLAENTQAIQDNTDAAFNFLTSQINESFNFSQGVFSGAQGFFQALSDATGANTLPQQLAALQGLATALATQSTGLAQQLAALTGDNTVLGLSGADLVNYLLSITSGPIFDEIMATLDPTQQDAFRDLVSALLGNATATEQNTQAIQNLVSPDAQSFSSTLWSTFRQAIFTGAGGLLPQYQTAIPIAAVGAHVLRSGMMIVHAGEDVRPAVVSRDWGDGGGDTYELNVTTPTEVLDPTDVGRQLAFYRKNQGRR